MSSTELAGDRLIPIDTEHSNQLIVPALALVTALVAHVVGLALFTSLLRKIASPVCAMLLIDAVVFVAAWSVIERIVRRVRPIRRYAVLSAEALVITDARRNLVQVTRIAWDKTVNINAWKFAISRRTRVPKGWYCLAVYLLQDETDAILYTFMNPQVAEAVIGYGHFVQLQKPTQSSGSDATLETLAEQRRLLKLENLRWQDGAEISPDDFNALLAVLQRHVPAWS
jgi:hypothetical protein